MTPARVREARRQVAERGRAGHALEGLDGGLLSVEDSIGISRGAAVLLAHEVHIAELQRRRRAEECNDILRRRREGQATHAQYAAVARVLAHGCTMALAERGLLGGCRGEHLDVATANLLVVRLEHLGQLRRRRERDERLACRVVQHRHRLWLEVDADAREELTDLLGTVRPGQATEARDVRLLLIPGSLEH